MTSSEAIKTGAHRLRADPIARGSIPQDAESEVARSIGRWIGIPERVAAKWFENRPIKDIRGDRIAG